MMNILFTIHRTLWILGGYILVSMLSEKPKDWRGWAVLICMFGMCLTTVFM